MRPNMIKRRNFSFFVYLIFAVLGVIFSLGPALAHKVTIFAWVEGDTVFTRSKFSGGRKAQNSTVVVYDRQGNRLLDGKTDRNGEFSFKIPQKTELKVALKASMGHAAEWTISVEEIVSGSAPLANSMDRGPGLTEIMGGIGYIFGLVGVAMYFASRRKND